MLPTDTGWIAQCPVFGCESLLEITLGLNEYQFECEHGHTQADVIAYLHADTRTDARAATRAWEALMLAPTPEVWAQLLKGHPVPADQVDHGFLARMRARRA